MKTKRLFFSVACLAATLAFGSTALCDGNDSMRDDFVGEIRKFMESVEIF